ncbi:hypothetical protein MTR_2g087370 [Medicago truncatula]|uniref:Uncharacterized protein n=1 Tax=Medicago truncatula TaxID=3880 RepID=G7IRE1_MEDTR|nr:hypothetical protein MTR_2g087370 [Medicago truncatula]
MDFKSEVNIFIEVLDEQVVIESKVVHTKWQSHYKLTHTSGGTGVRTPVIASGLTISAFCQLIGDAGYRSPYLSHAKRALYHLSYIPIYLRISNIKY